MQTCAFSFRPVHFSGGKQYLRSFRLELCLIESLTICAMNFLNVKFPGCFYCDTSSATYRAALTFHHACSALAGLLAFAFLGKFLVARRVCFDELSNPTTAAPAGLICMTLNIVFAGRGLVGMFVVCFASGIHLFLVLWFIYMTLAYHLMPEPSWFPNTVGIGIAAVKVWLYYPVVGQILMAVSMSSHHGCAIELILC